MQTQITAVPKFYIDIGIGIDIHKRSWKVHCATDLSSGRTFSMSPDPEREQLRSLFRRRNGLVKDMRQIKSHIQMQLLYYGIKVPERYDNDHWSHGFRDWLNGLPFDYMTGKKVLESRMRSFRFIDKEFRDVATQLRKWTKKHYKGDYMLLRSIPGIGPIVASGILSELGDLRRSNNIKQLAGYVGLSSGIYQSGDTIRHTGVSMCAQRLIRSYFIEASWPAIRTDPVMQGYYRKHRGKNVKFVIVKVARKLLSRTLAVIKQESPIQ